MKSWRYCFRYDVELFQRIEQLIEKKLPLFATEEQDVMQLQERVADAQRAAKLVSASHFSSRFEKLKLM